jgi:hypothetical protein
VPDTSCVAKQPARKPCRIRAADLTGAQQSGYDLSPQNFSPLSQTQSDNPAIVPPTYALLADPCEHVSKIATQRSAWDLNERLAEVRQVQASELCNLVSARRAADECEGDVGVRFRQDA